MVWIYLVLQYCIYYVYLLHLSITVLHYSTCTVSITYKINHLIDRINVGDVVLLGLRDFQDSKADLILKYTPDEARLLKSYGELADTVKINENDQVEGEEDDLDVEFDIDEI